MNVLPQYVRVSGWRGGTNKASSLTTRDGGANKAYHPFLTLTNINIHCMHACMHACMYVSTLKRVMLNSNN